MAVTSYIRRMFKNGVSASDTLASPITNAATTFSFTDGTTFPDGSVGPFVVTIDQGTASEEKVLVASRSGATGTVASSGRGYNGTTATAHAAGASILHTIDAQDMDEANQTMFQTLGAITAKGDLLVGSAANTLTKLAVGTTAQTLQVVSGTLSYVGFGSGRSQNVATSNADGTDTTYARSDHTHSGVTTFNTRNGGVTLTAADIEALFSADQQIFSGTGSGTGEIIDLLTALKEYFASSGQLIVGTGAGTGELLAKGATNAVLAVGGADASGLQWVLPGGGTASQSVLTSQTTTSGSYTDLATSGPAVTVTTGNNALVTVSALLHSSVQAQAAAMNFAVSGATTLAAPAGTVTLINEQTQDMMASATSYVSGLTAGSNTFTAKYEVTGGATGTFASRQIVVVPLP